MGKEIFCDLCRANIPVETALSTVKVDDEVVAELCLTCSSQMKTGMRQQIAGVTAKMNAAKNVIAVPEDPQVAPAPEAPQVAPPPATAPPPPTTV